VGGEGANGRTRAYRFLAETFGNWDLIDSDNQTLRITAGASQERNSTNFNYVAGTGFPTGFERYVRNAAQVSSFDGGETENTDTHDGGGSGGIIVAAAHRSSIAGSRSHADAATVLHRLDEFLGRDLRRPDRGKGRSHRLGGQATCGHEHGRGHSCQLETPC
jgi:hypothetical protein